MSVYAKARAHERIREVSRAGLDVASGRVAFVVSVGGTHHGPLATPAGNVPPTGKTITYEAAVLWTIDSDRLVAEERSYFDATGVAAQLGLTG